MSTTKAAHTPGPWERSTRSWDGEEYMTIETDDGAVIVMEPTEFSAYPSGAFITPDGYEPNMDRIVNCVNACEGIPDPQTVIPKLIEACEMAVSDLQRFRQYENPTIVTLRRALAATRGET